MHSTNNLAIAALISALVGTVAALPNGAPHCTINPAGMSSAMGGQTKDLGYQLVPESTTFQVGKPLKIQIKNDASFRGLLLYVQGANDAKIRNGNFVIPSGFKSNLPNCAADNLTVGPNGVVTHTSRDQKPGNPTFTWTADRCEDSIIRAVVVQDQTTWQVLSDVKITCASGATPAPPAGSPSPAPSPAPSAPSPAPAPAPSAPAPAPSTPGGYGEATPVAPAAPAAPAAPSDTCSCKPPSGADNSSGNAPAPPAPAPAPAPAPTPTPPSGADASSGTAPAPISPPPAQHKGKKKACKKRGGHKASPPAPVTAPPPAPVTAPPPAPVTAPPPSGAADNSANTGGYQTTPPPPPATHGY